MLDQYINIRLMLTFIASAAVIAITFPLLGLEK